MPFGETIMAPATPEGESAIAMVRVSGDLCLEITRQAFNENKDPIPRKSNLAYYRDLDNKEIDQILYTYFPENTSYTGEPLLEICCHGNPLIVQKISEDLIRRGCRLALGGEFTRTAFLNGKMDLSQAEAVCDLITARSESALNTAHRQLAGALGEKVALYSDQLLQIIAEVEAYIDFPEEDLPAEETQNIKDRIQTLCSDFEELIITSNYKLLLQNGIKTVIIGAPNAGKSSLLNVLVGEERALVSPIPGTTRDFISEQIMIGPFSIRIMDTAGIHETENEIEQMGIAKTIEKSKEADFHILVIDSSVPYPTFSQTIFEFLNPNNTLILENKVDLPRYVQNVDFLPNFQRCGISLKTKEGIHEFRSLLVRIFQSEIIKTNTDNLIINARHAAALKAAKKSLMTASENLANVPGEIIASELRQALEALQEIVGEFDNEVILDKLFSTFCIGK